LKVFVPSVIALSLMAGSGLARVSLSEDAHINNSLLAAAVGDEIRKNCDDISARMLTVFTKGKALEKYALNLGYTDDELKEFLESKTERKRMKALRDSYLKNGGVVKGDSATYCKLGQKEIAADSLTGQLLRSR